MDIIKQANKVLDTEIDALIKLKSNLDQSFEKIVYEITNCKGKLIISGIGKSGHIARKMVSTFSSLGTPSLFLHPSEAVHGDLGIVESTDLVMLISNSGESLEIINLLPSIKQIGSKIISVTSNSNSTLSNNSNFNFNIPKSDEACHLKLAPTSSALQVLAFGDTLAVICSEIYGFNKQNFALFHPSGSLGKKLITKVRDLMLKGEQVPLIETDSNLKTVLIKMNQHGKGFIIVQKNNFILGVLSDGDVRRFMDKELDIYTSKVDEYMNTKPVIIEEHILAIDALKLMNEKRISSLPVVKDGLVVGFINMHMILSAGIML